MEHQNLGADEHEEQDIHSHTYHENPVAAMEEEHVEIIGSSSAEDAASISDEEEQEFSDNTCSETEDETDSCDEDDNSFESTLKRAQFFFPGLDIGHGSVSRFGLTHGRRSTNAIKADLYDQIEWKLFKMDQETREHLLKSENAKECSLALGMNPDVVDMKFAATEKFKEVMGKDFKCLSILDSIFHLVDNLDFMSDSPFGDPNEEVEDNCREHDELSYFGMKINPTNYESKIISLENLLRELGIGGCFMYGTTAAGLEKNIAQGWIEPSTGQHDFGPGVYCFRGQLRWALAYAFHQSWPFIRTKKTNWQQDKDIARIPKDNPSVIVFRNVNVNNNDFFHVGKHEYPLSEEEIQDKLPDAKEYGCFKTEVKKWDGYEVKSQEFKWKYFVKLARSYGLVPKDKTIFHGWLHDSDYLEQTNDHRYEQPRIQTSQWEQYCFTDGLVLKVCQSLFIELHIDWAEWVGQRAL